MVKPLEREAKYTFTYSQLLSREAADWSLLAVSAKFRSKEGQPHPSVASAEARLTLRGHFLLPNDAGTTRIGSLLLRAEAKHTFT